MNQKIFTQIKNEWRTNVWLCLELLIVSVVLWYVVDYCYVSYSVASRPLGFNVDNCYKIDVSTLNESSPEYKQGLTGDDEHANYLELIDRLRRRPEVEAIAYSNNSHPYQGSNSGGDFTIDTLTAQGFNVLRRVDPDFFRVFRLTGVNGETPEQLAELLTDRAAIVSENLLSMDYDITDMRPYIGKGIYMYNDTTDVYGISAVVRTMRYNDFMQGRMNRTVFTRLNTPRWATELCVRVREGMDKDFITNLMADAESQYRVGNLYISRVTSFDDIRDNMLRSSRTERRNYLTGMAFLLLNIFLGLLGTFWFRTQQRTGDIAVRKVSGATRADIFRLLLSEGLLLLTVVTPLALLVDYNLTYLEFNAWMDGFFAWPRFLACGAITYGLMALMILLGIAIPARRAMHITPAEALRDE